MSRITPSVNEHFNPFLSTVTCLSAHIVLKLSVRVFPQPDLGKSILQSWYSHCFLVSAPSSSIVIKKKTGLKFIPLSSHFVQLSILVISSSTHQDLRVFFQALLGSFNSSVKHFKMQTICLLPWLCITKNEKKEIAWATSSIASKPDAVTLSQCCHNHTWCTFLVKHFLKLLL